MRRYLIITVIFATAILSSCFQQYNEDDTYRKGWTLAWEDDFNKLPDESVWSKTPRGKELMYKYMSENESLYDIQDGNIVLKAMMDPQGDNKLPFMTGGINIEAFKADETKRIEVRARINPTPGVIPYITLVPNNGTENIYVDLVEQYGTDKFVYQSVTSEYTTTEGMPDNPPSSALVSVKPNEYHIYGVEKYPDSLVFFVDGSRTKKYPRIPTEIPGQFPYNDLDFDLFIGLRLNNDTDSTVLPVDFYIDWVRFYEPDDIYSGTE
ncbi:MAG: glycoside hydrolase family 16 protein [Fermentimonas sp.]|nr:glycoside hydrolase family 16 protein [Fermentimonas sp.]